MKDDTITEIVIPGSINGNPVVEINSRAFSGVTQLTSIAFSEGLEVIGESAFSGCTGLKGNLNIPSSVTTIEEYAF